MEQGCSPSQPCSVGASVQEEPGAAKGMFPTAATRLLLLRAQEIPSSSSCIKEHLSISYYPQSLSDPMTAIFSVGFAVEPGCCLLML